MFQKSCSGGVLYYFSLCYMLPHHYGVTQERQQTPMNNEIKWHPIVDFKEVVLHINLSYYFYDYYYVFCRRLHGILLRLFVTHTRRLFCHIKHALIKFKERKTEYNTHEWHFKNIILKSFVLYSVFFFLLDFYSILNKGTTDDNVQRIDFSKIRKKFE